MKLIRLFEWHEQRWVPSRLRQFVTDYLGRLSNHYQLYHPVTPILAKLIKTSGQYKIVDYCSGCGGMLGHIQKKLLIQHQLDIPVVLTDKFPNIHLNKQAQHISYQAEPVDVLQATQPQQAIRTLFTAFHHFNPKQAKVILKQAVECKDPIAIFEFNEHSLKRYLFDLIIPASVFHLSAGIQPKSTLRFLMTYIFPIVPLMVWWDGWVSNLRAYSAKELKKMVGELDANDYIWEIGTIRAGLRFYKITYLIGQPKQDITHA